MVQVKTNYCVTDLHEFIKQKRESVVVCVTGQSACRILIEKGAELAQDLGMDLQVLSIMPRGKQNTQSAVALEELFHYAIKHDAAMSIYYSEQIWTTADHFLNRCRVRHIVVGKPSIDGTFVPRLWKKYSHIRLHVVETKKEEVQELILAK